jgi:hypothetical protein
MGILSIELRFFFPAPVKGLRASGMVLTPQGSILGIGNLPLDGVETSFLLEGAFSGHGFKQVLRVGVKGMGVKFLCSTGFHHPSRIQYTDPVADPTQERKVVGHEKNRHTGSLSSFLSG